VNIALIFNETSDSTFTDVTFTS